MEQENKTVSIDVDIKLDLLSDILGERIDPLPEWQAGKLVLWYGGEWVLYDEYDADERRRSRYPAGAYMQTIALNPGVITDPKYIADAAMRINQQFEDDEFAERFVRGMFNGEIDNIEESCFVLLLAGEYGRAGHWPSGYDWEQDKITWQLQPEELGAAIASFIDDESLPSVAERMLKIKAKKE